MSKALRIVAVTAIVFSSIWFGDVAHGATIMDVNITCEKDGIQETNTVGWDNENSFFEDKGDIARLYCEGGFSSLGYGATYVSDDLSDESLRYYGGIPTEPVVVEPEPEPSDTPTESETVSPEVEPSPEPEPEPSPEPSPEPTPEETPNPTPSPEPEPSPAPEEEPVVVPPTEEPQPQPEISDDPEPVETLEPSPGPEESTSQEELQEEPLSQTESPSEPPSTETIIPQIEEEPEPVDLIEDLLDNDDITDEEAEALIDAAMEVLETAEPGSEEYEAALDALALAATADDIELDEDIAAIPVIGALAEGLVNLINFADNVGADMAPETRERAEETVVAAVIVGQVAQVATSVSVSGGAYRRRIK